MELTVSGSGTISGGELSDEKVQELIESCKKKRLERTLSEMSQDQTGRVFVNRSVSMERIKYIGFDMDHTLVVYRSPEYDLLAYEMAMDRLVEVGYPQEIKNIAYDNTFPVRGLFFDKMTGHLLKLDAFGNILSCWHGLNPVSALETRRLYPNKYVQVGSKTIFNLDTLFQIAETYLLAVLVDFFGNHKSYKRLQDGVQNIHGDIKVTYSMIQQDVRNAVDWIHNQGGLKERTLDNLQRYVKKDYRLPKFLDKLRESGRKVFIATNSGYHYTKRLMSYLLNEGGKDWKSYFDYIIVDAKKPLFFQEGTTLREVDEETGSLRLGMFTGSLDKGKVFSGGSSEAFCTIAGAKGKEVLYVGDHIFGDIIKSKKEQAFRTFLVIPELTTEIESWESNRALFLRLQNLEFLLAEMYQRLGSDNSKQVDFPDITVLKDALKETAQSLEDSYPQRLGSLLRCGSRLTYFANQVLRFADLYSSTCVNLVNYPNHYLFNSSHQLMAHERSPQSSKPSAVPSLLPSDGGDHQLPTSPMAKLRGKSFGQSVVDFDLDEDFSNGHADFSKSQLSNISED